jgi:hypothetical protein
VRAHFTCPVNQSKGLSPPEAKNLSPHEIDSATQCPRLSPDQRQARLVELRAYLAGTAPEFEARRRHEEGQP